MKFAKKSLSLTLCVVLLLALFSGCSSVKNGFIVVNGKPALDRFVNCFCAIKGDTAFIYSDAYTFKEFEGDGEEDLVGYEPELERVDIMMTLLDVRKNEIINQKTFTHKEEIHPSSVAFENDNTLSVKYYSGYMELFDLDFNKLDKKDYDEKGDEQKYIHSNLKNEDMYCFVSGVYDCIQSEYHAYVFASDPNKAYISYNDNHGETCACIGKRVLTFANDLSDDYMRVNSAKFSVYDYESGKVLNSISTDFSDQKVRTHQVTGAMNDETALIIATKWVDIKDDSDKDTESEEQVDFYLWNYTADSVESDLDIKACTRKDVLDLSTDLARTISDDNGINVQFNVKSVPCYNDNLTEEDKYFVKYEIKDALQIYDDLLNIQSILENFPDGMVARMHNFSIYLVNYITGCSAYADNWVDETDNGSLNYFVVIGSGSSASLPHELMHCFEAYVDYTSDDFPFGDAYESLNIEDFTDYYKCFSNEESEKSEYISQFVFNDDNKDTACFISDYSTETSKEDKAEIFQLLYNFGLDPDTNDERKEIINTYPYINKKAKYICKILREYFPEIKDTPVWEKALT